MYVCLYACIMYMCVCIYYCMSVCLYVCVYVCNLCMYVCMYVLTPRLVALITHRIMLRRRVWAYSRRLSAQTVSGRCPGGARKTSGRCPGGVREGSGRRPREVFRGGTICYRGGRSGPLIEVKEVLEVPRGILED